MSRIKLIDLSAIIICVVPFIAWFALYNTLPERLPIDWNARGGVEGWTTRDRLPFFLLLMTGVSVVAYVLLRAIRWIDPKRTAALNEGTALKIGMAIVVFMAAANLLLIIPKGDDFNMTSVIFVMLGLLFTFLGNLMYNVKPNYFIGIRVPWALEDENNWRHTHRLAGVLWFVGGIICAVVALILSPESMFMFLIGMTVLLVLIPAIYSFSIYKRRRSAD